MRPGNLFIVVALVLAALIVSFTVAPELLLSQANRTKHKAEFTKVNGKKWKIKKITAKKGEEISWSATDSDLYFQFMDASLFGEYNYMVKKQNTLTLEAKGEKGTYYYSIFSIADSSYVEGNSPPAIIIP